MKSLISKIINSKFSIILRNNLNIKPAVYYYSSGHSKNLYNSSVSDCFCWRTDNGYETKFISVNHRKRHYGTSNYGTFKRLINGIKDMIKVKKILLNKKRV